LNNCVVSVAVLARRSRSNVSRARLDMLSVPSDGGPTCRSSPHDQSPAGAA
jgi:hypothetical protein